MRIYIAGYGSEPWHMAKILFLTIGQEFAVSQKYLTNRLELSNSTALQRFLVHYAIAWDRSFLHTHFELPYIKFGSRLTTVVHAIAHLLVWIIVPWFPNSFLKTKCTLNTATTLNQIKFNSPFDFNIFILFCSLLQVKGRLSCASCNHEVHLQKWTIRHVVQNSIVLKLYLAASQQSNICRLSLVEMYFFSNIVRTSDDFSY